MNDNLSNKLERINNAVSSIREIVSLPNADIDDVALAVQELPNGGGDNSSGTYRVGSVAEMQNLTGMNEGDICVIYSDNALINADTLSATFIFPAEVTVDEPRGTSAKTIWFTKEGRDIMDPDVTPDTLDAKLEAYPANVVYFRAFNMMEDEGIAEVNYSTQDGLHWTRVSISGSLVSENTVTFPYRMYLRGFDSWLAPFCLIAGAGYVGTYQYHNNAWVQLDNK